MNEAIRMQLSAFADGELPDNEKELLLRRLSQDPAMRRQLAEYFAIGRAMRGEAPVPGIDSLRERVAAAIGSMDHEGGEAIEATENPALAPNHRMLRPAAGLATAAAVALLAIVGLQKWSADAPETPAAARTFADEDNFSTQPEPDRLLDQYRLMHEAEAADSSMRTRVMSIEIRQGLAAEAEAAAHPDEDVKADDKENEDAAGDRASGQSSSDPAERE
jgi:negative regulator of sigma E activity